MSHAQTLAMLTARYRVVESQALLSKTIILLILFISGAQVNICLFSIAFVPLIRKEKTLYFPLIT